MNLEQAKTVFDDDQIEFFDNKVDFDTVIKILSKKLSEKKLVKQEFSKNVIEREKKFPTGLPTKPIGVSIPHTDAKWTKQNAISVAILQQPIEQVVMGTTDEKIEVSIVFLLALSQSNKQLNILSKLMTVFQNNQNLKQIKNGTKTEIREIIQKAIWEE
ncbi:PTS sugar transporter subunit IIA [Lactobacillus sp. ESL0677]|uniref:PTS sugar transporter subunit IIA n=1 Tax=Lactobacillus sp. ESL0677 TaxID=2983208 RepID=UPI0023F968EA|nr:PTS sugar transporter subunit IIA [Lactobacillus sp. ESL0677]WEV36270.1 PTS sugar transporter subunit IIA [Lactobacillus sp. ESL0677]